MRIFGGLTTRVLQTACHNSFFHASIIKLQRIKGIKAIEVIFKAVNG
jgi:hypothetical protein